MKKLLLILLCLPLLFNSCEEEEITITGIVKLEATCQTVPFEVSYHNEYENDVTETSNTTYWSKEFEAPSGHHCTLHFNNLNWNVLDASTKVNCFISIKWKGSVQTSYDGEVESYELIQAHL